MAIHLPSSEALVRFFDTIVRLAFWGVIALVAYIALSALDQYGILSYGLLVMALMVTGGTAAWLWERYAPAPAKAVLREVYPWFRFLRAVIWMVTLVFCDLILTPLRRLLKPLGITIPCFAIRH